MRYTLRIAVPAILLASLALGQEAAAPLTFEVADVQESKASPADPPRAQLLPGGRVQIFNAPMKRIILEAFSIAEDRLSGSESWFDSARYDIVAKAKPDSTDLQLREMLQNLLAERFAFKYHKVDKSMPVYALVVAKKTPKLQPAANTAPYKCGPVDGPEGMIHIACTNLTMDQLAINLPRMAPRYVDRPVVNLTELKGEHDLRLDWSPRAVGPGASPDAGAAGAIPAATDQAGLTIFEALETLGLKLDARKHPIATIAIDHIDRTPSGN